MNEIIMAVLMNVATVVILCTVGSILGFILYKLGFFADIKTEENKKLRLGRALAIMMGLTYMIQSILKMSHFGPMVEVWDTFSMTYLLRYVGMLEFILGLCLLIPKTYKLSVLLTTSVAGGAMATHLPIHADGFTGSLPSGLFLAIVWISAVLYTPEMFPGFISKIFHKRQNKSHN